MQVSWERISNVFFVFPPKHFASVEIKANVLLSILSMYSSISIIFALKFYNCSQRVEQQIRTEQNQLTRRDNHSNSKMCEWLHHHLLHSFRLYSLFYHSVSCLFLYIPSFHYHGDDAFPYSTNCKRNPYYDNFFIKFNLTKVQG